MLGKKKKMMQSKEKLFGYYQSYCLPSSTLVYRRKITHVHSFFMVFCAFKMKAYNSVKSLPRYLTRKIPTEGKEKNRFKRDGKLYQRIYNE